MGDRSGIEWTDATWNPIRARNLGTGRVGHWCVHASEGCRNCYSEAMQGRLFGNPVQFRAQDRDKVELFLDEEKLLQPLRWKRPRVIFPCSTTDLFGEWVPDEWLDRIWAVMALARHHTFLPLTKRPDRMREYLTGIMDGDRRLDGDELRAALIEGTAQSIYASRTGEDPAPWLAAHLPLSNVGLGVSIEDQRAADKRLPDLFASPAAWQWASYEPALGPVDFAPFLPGYECSVECGWRSIDPPPEERCDHCGWQGKAPEFCPECGYQLGTAVCPRCDSRAVYQHPDTQSLDWIVVGGESGPGARYCHYAWVRSIVGQCRAAGVPVFVKQLGARPVGDLGGFPSFRNRKGADMAEWPEDLRVREFPPSMAVSA